MKKRRGIVLAGGSGTRLFPATKVLSKQLMPVYDKPMIYYPLSTLMLGEVREVLVISTPHDIPRFHELLGDGSQWGMRIEYEEQPRPEGLAQAFLIGRDFLDGHPSTLILGDNIFYGHTLESQLLEADAQRSGATVLAYRVHDPERYGVVEFDQSGRAIGLEEKPARPRSHYAVTGLYYYDERVCDLAAELQPSKRGELEITDLNRMYLDSGDLNVLTMGRGMAWLDTGTHDSLLDASSFIATIQQRQGLMVSCPEEIAFRNGWIDASQLETLAAGLGKTQYGAYVGGLASDAARR